jgi:hypothetical protein
MPVLTTGTCQLCTWLGSLGVAIVIRLFLSCVYTCNVIGKIRVLMTGACYVRTCLVSLCVATAFNMILSCVYTQVVNYRGQSGSILPWLLGSSKKIEMILSYIYTGKEGCKNASVAYRCLSCLHLSWLLGCCNNNQNDLNLHLDWQRSVQNASDGDRLLSCF